MTSNRAERITLSRAQLSIGSFDLIRFAGYDQAFPKHAHEYYTVGVFDSACGSLRYRGAEWRSSPAAILAVSPFEIHAADPGRMGGWSYRTLYPSIDLMKAAASDMATGCDIALFAQPVFYDASLAQQLVTLHRRLVAREVGLEVEEALLSVLRALIHRHARVVYKDTSVTQPRRALVKAREFLEDNFAQPIRLAQLSAVCGMSPYHLVRSFRATYGLPPHAYLNQVRTLRARVMILEGESPAAVAYYCGFCDQSHLTRAFRSMYGLTPGAYVRELKNSEMRVRHN